MAASHLTAVANPAAGALDGAGPDCMGELVGLARPSETGAQRIRRLQHEARMLAREQIETLARDFESLAQRAVEVSESGDAYPAGVRELAFRIAADLPQKAQLLLTLMSRDARA